MTCQNDHDIHRRADGTIDFPYYESRSRRLRGEAILRLSYRILAPREHRSPRATDHIPLTRVTR
jgi:hypothetical protein